MKISDQFKKGINITLVVLILLFCVVFVYMLFKEDEDESPAETNDNQEVMDYIENSEKDENDNNHNDIENSNDNDTPMEEVDEDYEYEPQEVKEEFLSKSYEEIIDKKTVKETKALVNDFISIFYNLNGRYPMKYVDESKEYMTDDLYNEIKNNPEVGTYELFNRKFKKLEVSESKDFTEEDLENGIFYIVHVEGETENAELKNQKDVTDVFIVNVIKDSDTYKVNRITKNLTYR